MDNTIAEFDRSKYENFIGVVMSVKQPIYIVPHRDFCFDAIGSGLGLKRLLERSNIESRFCFDKPQQVAFPQNNALYNQLSLENYVTNPKEVKEDSSVIYVDSHPGGKLYKIRGFPFAVIDHHDLNERAKELIGDPRIRYSDIRPVASCTSIILSYLDKFGFLDFKSDNEEDVRLATAMYVGIRVDTDRLRAKSDMSLEFRYLPHIVKVADMDLIKEFEDRKFPPEVLHVLADMKSVSIGRYRVGMINSDKANFDVSPDLLSATVETLRIIGDATINIIIGYSKNNDFAIIKIRSDDHAYPAQEELERLFGVGGGKKGGGGAEVSLKDILFNIGLNKRAIKSPRLESRLEYVIGKKLESFS